MSKHTPGPWILGNRTDGGCWRVLDAPLWDAFAKVVIKMTDDNGDSEQGLANARLIASAPDLLASLKEMAADMKALADSGDAGFWDAEEQPIYQRAMAAIAKAEGSNV